MTVGSVQIGDYWRDRLDEAEEKGRTAPSGEIRRIHRMMALHYRQLETQWRRHDCEPAQAECSMSERLAA